VLKFEGYDFASDFWQIGICLYRFLTGKLPFGNENNSITDIDTFEKVIDSDRLSLHFPNFLKDEAAKDLIKKLLTYDPKERMTSFKDFKSHPWFENFHFVSR